MEIQVKVEDLKKNKLFVATPMYGGMAHGLYLKSCLDLQGIMSRYGVDVKFSFLFNESLITRARNYLVDEFLRSDCTHLLFLDSDIHYNPQDVVALLALDVLTPRNQSIGITLHMPHVTIQIWNHVNWKHWLVNMSSMLLKAHHNSQLPNH